MISLVIETITYALHEYCNVDFFLIYFHIYINSYKVFFTIY